MRHAILTIAAAAFTAAAVAAQPPADGVRVITGPPLSTLPPPGQLPPTAPPGSALKPWLTPPPGTTPPAARHEPAKGHAIAPPAPATPQRFDTTSLRLKFEQGQWQLWSGNLLLKDFGPAEADAHEALQVFRDLRVNSRGSVGGVFEYWLADGSAPSAMTRHRSIIPFDPATLGVEQMGGRWVLRDARTVLYNFGSSQADAQQALAVCKQYQFNQLGYVGHPVPALKYLMKDPTPRAAGPVPATVVPASAQMQEAAAAHPRRVLPAVGDVGDRVPLDARRMDLRREGGEWVLYGGHSPLAHYGPSERDGRLALEALQQFRVTELCRVGDSGFGFFLANGRPPQGTVIGTAARPLQSGLLNVRQVGTSWAVCEGQRPLVDFGDRADDARHALAAIREYHFDHVIPIGTGRTSNLYLFVKTRY